MAILAETTEVGSLGIYHLKRLWSSVMAAREGEFHDRKSEWHWDRLVCDVLGTGLHQTLNYLYSSAPSFDQLESWIKDTAGIPSAQQVQRFNAEITSAALTAFAEEQAEAVDAMPPVLTDKDLAHWQQHGYVIVRNAVSADACRAAEDVIWNFVGARADDRESWYRIQQHGIMTELVQHPALQANRESCRIRKAFAQLWQTTDLWVTADRCGFHPPNRPDRPFSGPDLHWDVDFSEPVGFFTQGILYLTDTPAEQGALTLVPGFQHRLHDWLAELPEGVDPQQQDLHALGSQPIAANAGDLIIWHHALPHGSRSNLADQPRMVQYINCYPGRLDHSPSWMAAR